jgi:hypothetical protein
VKWDVLRSVRASRYIGGLENNEIVANIYAFEIFERELKQKWNSKSKNKKEQNEMSKIMPY